MVANPQDSLLEYYGRVRATTLDLCRTLEPEDTVVQSMPDVSPTKWHLAHVTWFFERFVLEVFDARYERFNNQYGYLFNSYYYSAGQMHARPERGFLTRPTLADVVAYRAHVDAAMRSLLQRRADDAALYERTVLGLNHEQQHQELLLTDIKHVFSCNPLRPAVNAALKTAAASGHDTYTFVDGPTGMHRIGAAGGGFCFDNETPRHDVLLHPHRIGTRLVTNQEFREFIDDGGYCNSNLWLSDGWSTINERGWNRPLYWAEDLESEFTLGGQRDIDAHAPVCHVSFYEADAFARWAGARLPTEFEWEIAAAKESLHGNFLESGCWHPMAGSGKQFFGDVWEWTSSSYLPYPGFVPLLGSLGEYNGKFMCNQMTVRGGSCVTAADHIRASYRSFFYPDARWQFLGIRLAKDGIQ
ncbi:MAG: ergothioneine biosynthesis protein EgtB [Gammaproteobacteria bacterium]|nr:ergothioneine biosynthesis protein EgtB [Gammaproteobacteria bacterium]MDH3373601.1 ergothioneine biosynthesis protein EgtB [Gammaproteobacteria bacterium]MDH3409756.1 ergothioneine biosynthesis protein EgtB [Gammaproteobacteria bacterium]